MGVWALLLALIVLVMEAPPHELGHVLIAERYGIRPVRVELYSMYALRMHTLGVTIFEPGTRASNPRHWRVQLAYDGVWVVLSLALLVWILFAFEGLG